MNFNTNLILPFVYGIVFKIYDDIVDNKLNIDAYYTDILKYIVITFFSIIFYKDGVFSTLWFVMAFSSLIMDKFYTSKLEKSKDTTKQKDFTCFNDNLWVYSLFLSGFFVVFHFLKNLSNFQLNNLLNIKNITFFINIIINLIIVLFDIYYTPEHASQKKLYTRIILLILLSLFFYFILRFSDYIYDGNYGIILMNIGFLIGSVCFLTLDKFKVFDNFKNKEHAIEELNKQQILP